jgi:dinuclear metal center YbgI/SA1388 family protein
VTTTVADVLAVAEKLWPTAGAESWDAVGLVTGDRTSGVSSILLCVDAVVETVDEAISSGVGMLFSHHPLLLRGVSTVAEDRYKGALVARLIRASCALLTAHTNADVVESGTSATLAAKLGLVEVRPLAGDSGPNGVGRVGRLAAPTTLGRLARQLADILPATAGGVRVSGDYDAPVETVALCAGAGDAYLTEPAVVSSDVYITSDLRHHPASEFRENARFARGTALMDVSHWASEWLWLDVAAEQLRAALPKVAVAVSDIRTDPWDFAVVQ